MNERNAEMRQRLYTKNVQMIFRRLIRRIYDKQFLEKHGVPRRKGREDYVLLLELVSQFYESGELDYKEMLVLAEPLSMRIKGLYAKKVLKKEEYQEALLLLQTLQDSIIGKFRIGESQ